MTTLRHARNRTQRVSDAFSSSYYPLFSTLLLSCSYEIMSPETIGLQRHDEAGIVLGKHSGR